MEKGPLIPQPHGGAVRPRRKGEGGLPGAGRPRKLVNTVIKELQDSGVEQVSAESVNSAFKTMLNCTEQELRKIEKDPAAAYLLRSVARQMLSPRGQEMINSMIERAHGKTAGSLAIVAASTGGQQDSNTITGVTITIVGGVQPPITSEAELDNL